MKIDKVEMKLLLNNTNRCSC